MKKGRLTMLAIMLALVSSGYSQVALTARSSELSYGWLYGYGPQSDSGSGGALRSDLVALDTIGIQNFASGNGNYLGHLWSAGVSWDLSHSYRVFGGLNSASRIESVGLSSLTSFESGASSGINSNFPGNQLNLNFQVPTTQTFYLGGVLNQQGPLNRDAAAIYLYYDTGFGYQTVYVAGTPTSQFGAVITLQSGNYKLSASSASAAGQNEVANAGWTYVFASLGNPPVPLSSITVVEERRVSRRLGVRCC